MAARLEQNAKRRVEKKLASIAETALPGSSEEFEDRLSAILAKIQAARGERREKHRSETKSASTAKTILPPFDGFFGAQFDVFFATEFEQAGSLSPHLPSSVEVRGAALWDEAVESLGRSAEVLEALAESSGEAIARIAARGDRIDRIQKETCVLLNDLMALEADA